MPLNRKLINEFIQFIDAQEEVAQSAPNSNCSIYCINNSFINVLYSVLKQSEFCTQYEDLKKYIERLQYLHEQKSIAINETLTNITYSSEYSILQSTCDAKFNAILPAYQPQATVSEVSP